MPIHTSNWALVSRFATVAYLCEFQKFSVDNGLRRGIKITNIDNFNGKILRNFGTRSQLFDSKLWLLNRIRFWIPFPPQLGPRFETCWTIFFVVRRFEPAASAKTFSATLLSTAFPVRTILFESV